MCNCSSSGVWPRSGGMHVAEQSRVHSQQGKLIEFAPPRSLEFMLVSSGLAEENCVDGDEAEQERRAAAYEPQHHGEHV